MVAATHRLEAVDRQAATPMAVQAVMPQLAKTTVDQRVTKEWLTIAATIGFRRVIVTAVMDEYERPRATMTIVTMVIVTIVTDISSTVCGSGMALHLLLTTAVG
jgi:hypothetical protein